MVVVSLKISGPEAYGGSLLRSRQAFPIASRLRPQGTSLWAITGPIEELDSVAL